MFLEDIRIRNFRNIESVSLSLRSKTNVFFGTNGQGKTNFLEALYILINRRSFRRTEGEIILNGNDYCTIEGILNSDGIRNRVSFWLDKKKKVFLVDEKRNKKRLPIKTFFLSSDVLFYFKNFPFYRRKLIDKMCYYLYGNEFLPVYNMLIKSKKNFSRVVENKERQIIGGILAKYKKIVDSYRVKLLEDIKNDFDEIKSEMNLPEINIKIIRDERDDIIFLKNDKRYLSLGEIKSVIFLMYISVLTKKRDSEAIMLIDDFNSEWDNNKIENAFSILSNLDIQSFVMTNQKVIKADFEIRKGEIGIL
ncbi:MAG: AAA family ATPase [Proteobacteria bacterium]|nr:AAA family ATPase [Pseudomonadota bacterium]